MFTVATSLPATLLLSIGLGLPGRTGNAAGDVTGNQETAIQRAITRKR